MKLKDTRIVFMGTSFFAKEILENLVSNEIPIKLVVTQTDKLAGRKKQLRSSEVKIFTQKNQLKIAQFEKLDDQAFETLETFKPQLVIVASYGLIIPEKFLLAPEFGYVNIHTSLLPKLRGPSPIQTALLQGLKETGVTIMQMDPGVDSGDILAQEKVKINPQDNHPALEKKLIEKSNQILIKILEKYINKNITPERQNNDKATFSKIIQKKDGQINWSKTNQEIYNSFRAFYGWPQIYSFWENRKRTMKITLTEVEMSPEEETKENGEIYKKDQKVLVKTSRGSLVIKKLKLEGKPETKIKNFLNGYPDFIGSRLK